MDNLNSVYSRDLEMGSWMNDYVNMSHFCRVCGSPNDYLIPIFEGEGSKHCLDSKIRIYLPIQVMRDDVLPLHVCYNCASAIISWHGLYMNCREADTKLRNLLGLKHIVNISNELDHSSVVSSPSHIQLVPHSQPTQISDHSSEPRVGLEEAVLSQDAAQPLSIKNCTADPFHLIPDGSVLEYPSQDSQSTLNFMVNPSVSSTVMNVSSTANPIQEPTMFLNVSTQTDNLKDTMDATTTSKKFVMAKRILRNCSVVVKKKKIHHNNSIIQEASVGYHHDHEKTKPVFEDSQQSLPSRVSAIQSTLLSNHMQTVKRSETVLVRNEAVWGESKRSGSIGIQCQAVESPTESVVPLQQSVSHDILLGTSVVSFARPTCLRRAPTKCSENAASAELKSGSCQGDSSSTISYFPSQISDNHEGVIVGSPQGDASSPGSTVEEDRDIDPTRTCFHCGKVINNIVLLHAHEKGHLSEQLPPTSFTCKFCSEPQNSFIEMSSHHAQHEADAERQRKNAANRRALLCKHCGQMCTTEEKLALHQRTHSDNMEACIHTCKTCGESFHTRSKLSVHLWSHAIKPSHKVLKCHICGKGFSTKCAVLEHRLKHTEEERSHAFKCIICGMAFGNNTLLGKHRATHSEEELARPFKCSFCGKAFARNHTLQIHHLTHSEEKSHLCNQCGKGFKMRNSLIQHLRTHQDPSSWPSFPCHMCSKTFRVKSRLRDHLRLHNGEKPFICSTCGKRFHKITALHTHEVSHTERRPYMCDICGKAFKWSKNLRQHKAVHGNADNELQGHPPTNQKSKIKSKNQPCQCEVCGKQLSGKSSLRQHITNVHNEGTQKQTTSTTCTVCGKALSSTGGLARHMRITHEGIKAFKCDLCDREYSTKVARDDHRRSHTGERPFTCNICSKTFTSLSNLHIHRTIHSEERPHKCSFCEKQFKRKAHLILHTRTHTGEKPYVCNICSRGFAQSNDLHKHCLTHSNDKAYACHCGMSFRLKRDLTRHQMKHHPHVVGPEEPRDQHVSNLHSSQPLTSSSPNDHSFAVVQEQNLANSSELFSTTSIGNAYEQNYTSSVLVRCTDVLLTIPD